MVTKIGSEGPCTTTEGCDSGASHDSGGSKCFLLESGVFGVFGHFSVNSADAERVLRAVTAPVTTEDSVYGCGSETARDWTLFWCTGGCGVSDDSDELAVSV